MADKKNDKKTTTGRSTPRRGTVNRDGGANPAPLTPAARPNEVPTIVNRGGNDERYMAGTDKTGQRYARQYDKSDMVASMHAQTAELRHNAANHREYVYARRNEDRQRILDEHQRFKDYMAGEKKKYADRNFEGRKFSGQEGWDNLGRGKGKDAEGNDVTYSRGKDIKDYDARYGALKDKMDQLGTMFKNGDHTGKGREYEAIRGMIEKSHNGGGLTEAQLEAAEKKLEAYRGGLKESAAKANAGMASHARQQIAERRKAAGDPEGLMTDQQVNEAYNQRRSSAVQKAVDRYLKNTGSMTDTADRAIDYNERYAAIDALAKVGLTSASIVKQAIRGGDKNVLEQYKALSNLTGQARQDAIDKLGMTYLRDNMAKDKTFLDNKVFSDGALTFDKDGKVTGTGTSNDLSAYEWKTAKPEPEPEPEPEPAEPPPMPQAPGTGPRVGNDPAKSGAPTPIEPKVTTQPGEMTLTSGGTDGMTPTQITVPSALPNGPTKKGVAARWEDAARAVPLEPKGADSATPPAVAPVKPVPPAENPDTLNKGLLRRDM